MTTVMEPLAPLLRDLNRYFGARGAMGGFMPPADILVTDQDVKVYLDVPGVSREQLEIELENNILTVRGERPYPYGVRGSGSSAASAGSSATSVSRKDSIPGPCRLTSRREC